MSEHEDGETLEERTRRLERQRVHPEDESRKVPAEAEKQMESAEDEAVPPSGRTERG